MGTTMAAASQATAMEKQNSVPDNACIATTPAEQIALNAAKNEARQMAEATNGGLNVYRAEPAMHGASVQSPCEMLEAETWRFTIRGGEPTAVVLSEEYTTLSIVTVEESGRDRSVTLEYNGPIDEYNQ
ncbi:purine nucleoside permease [Leptolyngbya sp. Heron Island J]|uniref:hypothetical protein n=1 Tax=Leptolyngbya sp. Heron Island J TaxID=1385935 RepID=UPI0003B95DF1|nr:hypothetical protein [Leptolyngbya sp. Heron Island J]ESA32059.1 purine nucleoside permease [Leptolyngbya sp. Heron Island J]